MQSNGTVRVLVCVSQVLAMAELRRLLQASGFRKVLNVPGSYAAWAASGFPVVRPANVNRKASDTER